MFYAFSVIGISMISGVLIEIIHILYNYYTVTKKNKVDSVDSMQRSCVCAMSQIQSHRRGAWRIFHDQIGNTTTLHEKIIDESRRKIV